jgi:hypothetical protein
MSSDVVPEIVAALLKDRGPAGDILRNQFGSASISWRLEDAGGLSVTFAVPPEAPRVNSAYLHFGALVEIMGLKDGAGADLVVRDGALSFLDVLPYSEEWPAEPVVTEVKRSDAP